MKQQNFKKYMVLRESSKDKVLNTILDKISSGNKITNVEETFLSKYDTILDIDISDLSHLSMSSTFLKISGLLGVGKKVICELFDKFGKIDDDIVSIESDFDNECCIMSLRHGDKAKLFDRYLYNISYSFSGDKYSLHSQDEYFEKISISNEYN